MTELTKLHFTHGTEIENHLVEAATGEVLVGDQLLITWDDMFNKAFDFLKVIKKNKSTPTYIKDKIVKVEVAEELKREKKLKFVFIYYKLGKKTLKINTFGPDPNISQITWLLELVTPPCEYLEELEFWIDILYSAAEKGLGTEYKLLPIGINPLEENYRSGLSCGEHHHIGVSKTDVVPVYNMIRNFIPHLIALSSASPFINKKVSGKVLIKEKEGKKQVIGRCIRSYRLLNNTGQMGPNIPEYLPHINAKTTRKQFAKLVKKPIPEDRMVDIFPFTDYSTIEIRFFDAQPYKDLRLALVILLQSLAKKAVEVKEIPEVDSAKLIDNRRKSINFGLLGQFKRDDNLPEEFAKIYNYDNTGKNASKVLDSVKSMLIYIKEELQFFNKPELVNLLVSSVFGSEEFHSPFCVSDYLVYNFSIRGKIDNMMPLLIYQKNNNLGIQSSVNFDALERKEIVEDKKKKKKKDLGKALQSDMNQKFKRKSTKKIKKAIEKKKPKKKEKKPIIKEEQPIVEIEEPPAIVSDIDEIDKYIQPIQDIITQAKESEPKTKPKTKKKKKPKVKPEVETQISTFDDSDEIEILSPTINIEPKYKKIESKIAKAMQTRRVHIEEERKVLFKAHLAADRRIFKPKPKVKFNFPKMVTGDEIFGYIHITFGDIKVVMYKLRNNKVIFNLKAKVGEKEVITSVRTSIDLSKIERSKVTSIPMKISLGELTGEIIVDVEAVTATNEQLFDYKSCFRIKRKDEIPIKTEEFYVSDNYGIVETVYKGKNLSDNIKGELSLYLASQSFREPKLICTTKFEAKKNERIELAKSLELLVNYHHSTFYIVSKITTKKTKKNAKWKVVTIKNLENPILEWDYSVDPEKLENGKYKDLTEGIAPRSNYNVDFVLHFLKEMPPSSLVVNVHSFPEGKTKQLAEFSMKNRIDAGDEFIIENIKWRSPKRCSYIFFDLEVRNEQGFIPYELISDPIGINNKKE